MTFPTSIFQGLIDLHFVLLLFRIVLIVVSTLFTFTAILYVSTESLIVYRFALSKAMPAKLIFLNLAHGFAAKIFTRQFFEFKEITLVISFKTLISLWNLKTRKKKIVCFLYFFILNL
jgi:hypothetical protein